MAVFGIAGDHCDNPYEYANHICVAGSEILLRPVKLIGNKKKSVGFTNMILLF